MTPIKLTRFHYSPANALRFGGDGARGGFSLGHFIDPLGLAVGKGKGGGAKNFWDPASIFTGGKDAASGPSTQPAPIPGPTPPITPANAAVINIQQATRREALRKKGISSTVYAGATGGWFPSVGTAGGMGAIGPVMNSGPGKTG